MKVSSVVLAATLCGAVAATAPAAIVPFTEEFTAGSSSWFNPAGNAPLDWTATGGPDGSGYATTPFNFAATAPNATPLIFRGQDNFNSSGGAFVGNWLAEGVTSLDFFVRHDATVPLTFFARLAPPANFPAAVALNFAPILPNTWTHIVIPIDPANPQFITFEGSDFNTTLSNVARLQIGINVPAALAGQNVTFNFDLDRVSIVPAPGSLTAAVMLVALGRRRRR
jgi:hypothetical protein